MILRTRALAVVAAAAFLIPAPAHAQWDVEVDPIAFGLGGYSAHLGYRFDVFRVDVGVFGVDVPEAFHGNEDWELRGRGVGVKLDYVGSGRGLFAGVEADYSRGRFALTGVDESVTRNGFAAGGRVGYQIDIGRSGLYVTPWVGLAYTFGELDVTIADRTFEGSRMRIFPTVHIGWRF